MNRKPLITLRPFGKFATEPFVVIFSNVLYQLLSIVSIAAVYDVNPVEAVPAMSDCDRVATALIPGFDEVDFDEVRHFTRLDFFLSRGRELREVPLHDITDMTS